jgi:pilin isopeptide linkage protein
MFNKSGGFRPQHHNDYKNQDLIDFVNAVTKDSTKQYDSIKGTLFYKIASTMVSYRDMINSPDDILKMYNSSDQSSLKETATQNAIWALMTDYGISKNQYASNQLYGLEKTLYDTAQDTSVLLNEKPNVENVSIVSADENVSDNVAKTFTYNQNDGKWYTGNLKIKEPNNYNGSYTIHFNDSSNISIDGQNENIISGNKSFRLVSSTQPGAKTTVTAHASIPYIKDVYVYTPVSGTGTLPEGDTKNGFQSMIGVKVQNVEIDTSASIDNNTGGLKLTKSFSFANGMTEDQKTAEKNKVTFTIQGEDDNTKNMTPITVKYSDLDSSGSKTIYGLTPGKYKVTESELGNDAYDVKTTYENSDTVTVSPGETTSEIITNTYSKKPTGSLTLKKSFDFGQDTDHPNPDTSKITFTLQRQDDISGFSKSVSYKDFQNGSYTVKDLPVGTYKITESGADVSGYADSLTVSVNGKTTGTIEVAKDGTTAAELKNTYTPTGSLTIHKSFVNSPLTETQKNGITFTITGKNTNETRTVSFDKFSTVSTDGKYTFTDLPVDTYTIKESNAGGTVLTAYKDSAGNILKDKQAAVSKGADTAVDVTNTYPSTPETPITVTPTTADLRVQKLIIGNDGNWPEGASFTMNLQAKDNAPMPDGTVNGVKSITVSSESPASFGTIQYEKAGIYHYIVTESKGSDKNFTYDETQHPVTVTVTESADHKLTASISGGNSSGIVEISNHYTKPKEENGGKEENSGGNKTNGSTNNSSGKNSSGGSKTNGSTSSKTNGQVQPANTKTLKNSLAKTNPSGSADSSGNASGSLVRTGDQTDLAVMIALLLTSACGLAGVLALKKKRRDDRTSEDRQ